MKDLVIGDVHFGIKSNNISWLEMQVKFFEQQVIPLIPEHERVVFLGDLFDIRYSVNNQIALEVKNLVRKIANSGKPVYFVAGNHDYYSPVQDFEHINSYETVFGVEFTQIYKNVHFVTEAPVLDNRCLFLPWYYTEDIERFRQVTHDYKNEYDVIYCHTDLEHWTQEQIAMKRNATVIAGHIHYPFADTQNQLYNFCACCAFTFNDVNQERYIHTVELNTDNTLHLTQHKNVTTPRFKRWHNEEIFLLNNSDFENTISQLCISEDNIAKARYVERIKQLKSENISSNIKVVVVNNEFVASEDAAAAFTTNIHQYIKQNIPDHLRDKYEILEQRVNESKKH